MEFSKSNFDKESFLKFFLSCKILQINKKNFDENINYDPNFTVKFLYERYINRQELNNLVGDISPYWNMDEEYEYESILNIDDHLINYS